MARLAGKFAGIVLVEVPSDAMAGVRDDAARLSAEVGLDVVVTPADSAAPDDGDLFTLSLVGRDRPGIVREVSAALAEPGVTIDEFATRPHPPQSPDRGRRAARALGDARRVQNRSLEHVYQPTGAHPHERCACGQPRLIRNRPAPGETTAALSATLSP